MVQFSYFNFVNHTIILLLLYYWYLPIIYFTFTLLSETCIKFNSEQVVTVTLCVIGVTQVCMYKLQKLEDDYFW
jgi:hypothetical protein